MHVLEHLGELRRRLIYCAAAVLLFSIISYAFSAGVFEILTSSFREAFPADSLIGTGPAEALFLKFKMAAFCGVLISLPVLFYQIWAFVAPGLYPQERKWVLPFVGSSVLLFALGAAFCKGCGRTEHHQTGKNQRGTFHGVPPTADRVLFRP